MSHDAGDGVSADELRALVLDVRTRLGNEAPTLVSMAAVSGGRPVVIVATNEQARQAGLQAGALVKVGSTGAVPVHRPDAAMGTMRRDGGTAERRHPSRAPCVPG